MSLAILIVFLAGAVSLSIASMPFIASPNRGAGLMLVTYVIEAIVIEFPPIPLGLSIYPQDLLFGVLLTAGAWRYITRRARLDRGRALIAALTILLLISFARGALAYGVKAAGVEVRGLFWFFSGSMYFSAFSYGKRRISRLVRQCHLAACALLVLAIGRWIATGLHLGIADTWAEPGQPAMRVLNSNAAMFLCIALFFSLLLHLSHSGARWQRRLFLALGPALLVLQHRTVWIVILIGFALLFRNHARSLRKTALTLATMTAVVTLVLFATFGTDLVLTSLQNSFTNGDDFLWRVAGWYQLLFNRGTGFMGYLMGDPFGSGFTRLIATTRVEVSPHNFYIVTFLRLGSVGASLLVWLYVSQLLVCRRLAGGRATRFSARAWQIFIVAHLIYFIAYNPGYEESLLLGMVVGGMLPLHAFVRAQVKAAPVRLLLPDPFQPESAEGRV